MKFICFRFAPRLAVCAALSLTLLLVQFAGRAAAQDFVRQMQADAVSSGQAKWGRWGVEPGKYSSWKDHTNRLTPIYTFGATLEAYTGRNNVYHNNKLIERLYGQLPTGTLNPSAEYVDQTDVYYLQRAALEAGKKYVVLIIFDGLDWDTTRAAAIYSRQKVGYESGRGAGLSFQDYQGAPTDFGYFVTSPWDDGTQGNVDTQTVIEGGTLLRGGYDAQLGGANPWAKPGNPAYLLGQGAPGTARIHAYTDSAASGTSLTCGIKTYNDAINVNPRGQKFRTIAMLAQDKGYKVGAVTSVPLCDATPAVAYAHNVSRRDYQDISRDLLGLSSVSHKAQPLSGLDVLIGTGWGQTKEQDAEQGANYVAGNPYLTAGDLSAVDVRNGGKYRIVQRAAGINGATALEKAATEAAAGRQRLLGFFGTSYNHLPYETADGNFDPAPSVGVEAEKYTRADIEENPRLKDLAGAALNVLSAGDSRFWLMIEAGDVDWANHGNNIDNSIGAIRSGDAAFRVVADWMEKHNAWNDAVVIVTADHGHYFVLTDAEAFTGAKKPAGPALGQ